MLMCGRLAESGLRTMTEASAALTPPNAVALVPTGRAPHFFSGDRRTFLWKELGGLDPLCAPADVRSRIWKKKSFLPLLHWRIGPKKHEGIASRSPTCGGGNARDIVRASDTGGRGFAKSWLSEGWNGLRNFSSGSCRERRRPRQKKRCAESALSSDDSDGSEDATIFGKEDTQVRQLYQ